MKIIELIAKGIGALFKFAFALVGITFLTAIVLFILTIFLPENVMFAVEIVKSLFT